MRKIMASKGADRIFVSLLRGFLWVGLVVWLLIWLPAIFLLLNS